MRISLLEITTFSETWFSTTMDSNYSPEITRRNRAIRPIESSRVSMKMFLRESARSGVRRLFVTPPVSRDKVVAQGLNLVLISSCLTTMLLWIRLLVLVMIWLQSSNVWNLTMTYFRKMPATLTGATKYTPPNVLIPLSLLLSMARPCSLLWWHSVMSNLVTIQTFVGMTRAIGTTILKYRASVERIKSMTSGSIQT